MTQRNRDGYVRSLVDTGFTSVNVDNLVKGMVYRKGKFESPVGGEIQSKASNMRIWSEEDGEFILTNLSRKSVDTFQPYYTVKTPDNQREICDSTDEKNVEMNMDDILLSIYSREVLNRNPVFIEYDVLRHISMLSDDRLVFVIDTMTKGNPVTVYKEKDIDVPYDFLKNAAGAIGYTFPEYDNILIMRDHLYNNTVLLYKMEIH